jgi:hypothetical protein
MRKLNTLMSVIVLGLGTTNVMLAQPQQIQLRQGTISGGIPATGVATGGELVKGAPYSAEAVTETTQTLADGNRITRKTSSKMYRDSEGRERREEALDASTGLSATPDRAPTVYISDPAAGANYVLNVLDHSAIRIPKPSAPPPAFGNSNAGNSAGGFAPTITFQPMPGPGGVGAPIPQIIITPGNQVQITGPNGLPGPPLPPPAVSPTRIERLGLRMIEGLQAEGTRTIETIPVDRAGNDQPPGGTNLEIVSETWVSLDLKVALMTRHSDPRTGETAYRLINITRADPARALFEIPLDYSISEMPAISGGMITGGVSVGPVAPR